MLVRLWNKCKIPSLLVGQYTSTVTYGDPYGDSSEKCQMIYLKIQLPHSWGIYPKYSLSYLEDSCSSIFIDAICIIDKNWKQAWCLSTAKCGMFRQWKISQFYKITKMILQNFQRNE